MIKHVVFFKMKPDLTDQEMADFKRAVGNLPKEISLAQNWCDGRNDNPRAQPYDYAVVCDFANWDAFNEYVDHPAHQAFIRDYLTPLVAHRAVADVEY